MPHWLFLPDDTLQDLAILASLSKSQIATLKEFLDSNEYRPKYAFFTKVAELLGISDQSAANLCTFVGYVQTQRARGKRPGASVPTEFEYFLTRAARDKEVQPEAERLLEFIRANKALIADLFSDFPKHDLSEK